MSRRELASIEAWRHSASKIIAAIQKSDKHRTAWLYDPVVVLEDLGWTVAEPLRAPLRAMGAFPASRERSARAASVLRGKNMPRWVRDTQLRLPGEKRQKTVSKPMTPSKGTRNPLGGFDAVVQIGQTIAETLPGVLFDEDVLPEVQDFVVVESVDLLGKPVPIQIHGRVRLGRPRAVSLGANTFAATLPLAVSVAGSAGELDDFHASVGFEVRVIGKVDLQSGLVGVHLDQLAEIRISQPDKFVFEDLPEGHNEFAMYLRPFLIERAKTLQLEGVQVSSLNLSDTILSEMLASALPALWDDPWGYLETVVGGLVDEALVFPVVAPLDAVLSAIPATSTGLGGHIVAGPAGNVVTAQTGITVGPVASLGGFSWPGVIGQSGLVAGFTPPDQIGVGVSGPVFNAAFAAFWAASVDGTTVSQGDLVVDLGPLSSVSLEDGCVRIAFSFTKVNSFLGIDLLSPDIDGVATACLQLAFAANGTIVPTLGSIDQDLDGADVAWFLITGGVLSVLAGIVGTVFLGGLGGFVTAGAAGAVLGVETLKPDLFSSGSAGGAPGLAGGGFTVPVVLPIPGTSLGLPLAWNAVIAKKGELLVTASTTPPSPTVASPALAKISWKPLDALWNGFIHPHEQGWAWTWEEVSRTESTDVSFDNLAGGFAFVYVTTVVERKRWFSWARTTASGFEGPTEHRWTIDGEAVEAVGDTIQVELSPEPGTTVGPLFVAVEVQDVFGRTVQDLHATPAVWGEERIRTTRRVARAEKAGTPKLDLDVVGTGFSLPEGPPARPPGIPSAPRWAKRSPWRASGVPMKRKARRAPSPRRSD